MRWEDVHLCNLRPTISELTADGPETGESSNQGTLCVPFQSHVRKSNWPRTRNGGSQYLDAQGSDQIVEVLGEDPISVMDQIAMPSSIPHDLPQLLHGPVGGRIRCHIDMRQPPRAVLDHYEYVQHPERRCDCDEEVARENRLCMVLQEGRPALIARGGPGGHAGMFLTVLGETRMPNFTNSSLAIRSSPHNGFSLAIRRMSRRSSNGMGGRPGRDL